MNESEVTVDKNIRLRFALAEAIRALDKKSAISEALQDDERDDKAGLKYALSDPRLELPEYLSDALLRYNVFLQKEITEKVIAPRLIEEAVKNKLPLSRKSLKRNAFDAIAEQLGMTEGTVENHHGKANKEEAKKEALKPAGIEPRIIKDRPIGDQISYTHIAATDIDPSKLTRPVLSASGWVLPGPAPKPKVSRTKSK